MGKGSYNHWHSSYIRELDGIKNELLHRTQNHHIQFLLQYGCVFLYENHRFRLMFNSSLFTKMDVFFYENLPWQRTLTSHGLYHHVFKLAGVIDGHDPSPISTVDS